MHILVTNDDGIHSKGIFAAAKELSKNHKVTVVAPDVQRSACGHAITLHVPLMLQKVQIDGLDDIDCFVTNGTPADCVKLAVGQVLPKKPDIVVSGINNGSNVGTDILYSGTVSGALEGAILGVRSFALSIDNFAPKHMEDAARFFAMFLDRYDLTKIPGDVVLNINFPDLAFEDIKGIAAAPQGITRYTGEFKERSHPRGFTYYWLAGELEQQDEEGPDTDVKLLKQGYVAVTPLRFNLTDERCLDVLQEEMKNIR